MQVKIGEYYRHKRTQSIYKVEAFVLNTETDELDVLYSPVSYTFPYNFVRPKKVFEDGRFELVCDCKVKE